PASLHDLFQDIYHEIAGKKDSGSQTGAGRQRARLLQLLCGAREPLGFEPLAELLASAGISLSLEDCRDRLLEMSEYLLDTGSNRFKPWHQGLVDFVRAHILGTAGCREIEEIFCAWLSRPANSRSPYALRHRASH